MTLSPGTGIGHYEIVSIIGAGGMGEVYRARDPKLGREVALKVLPAQLAQDPERLARFEREAKLLASLNHPNIAHVYGFEAAALQDGSSAHFLAMELVAGEDLAERLKRGAIPVDESIAIAKQIAEGLEEAHAHGVIHRDLKPANVKVTPDGKVKVLDFGLAKGLEGDPPLSGAASQLSHSPTMSRHLTEAGMIMGTAAYMSPEQARGKAVDKRADIWSFGVVLFEMLTGQRLFAGETVSDVLVAVLSKDPDLSTLPAQAQGPLRQLLRRCLERTPRDRLHDAADARLVLDDIIAGRAETLPERDASGKAGAGRRALLVAVPLALAAGLGFGGLMGRGIAEVPEITFERLTFATGHFPDARFAPDGQTVFYGASWDGNPREIYQSRPQAGELALGLHAFLHSVSPMGELAVVLRKEPHGPHPYLERGTLAVVSASGGTPRELADDVMAADWAPDGKSLAVVRQSGLLSWIEYPLGRILHRAEAIYEARVSPDGEKVAFFQREKGDLSVRIVNRDGVSQVLSSGWADWWNLAWSADGREIWFGAARAGAASALYAVTLEGQLRRLLTAPGTLELQDTAKDGRTLVARVSTRSVVFGRTATDAEINLGWLDLSEVVDLSIDGRLLLLRGQSENAAGDSVILRAMGGTPPVRLGEGRPAQLSPDGNWALALRENVVVALPTGAGQARARDTALASVAAARFMPDGRNILIASRETDGRLSLHLMDLDAETPLRQLAEPLLLRFSPRQIALAISPDGQRVAVTKDAGGIALVPLDGSAATDLPGGHANDWPIQWSTNGTKLYVYNPAELPARVFAVDAQTGKREGSLVIGPRDPTGVVGVYNVVMARDARSYAYGYYRYNSDLYVARGLR